MDGFRRTDSRDSEERRRPVILSVSLVLGLGLSLHAQVDETDVSFTPGEREFVERFSATLERLREMPLDAFSEDYATGRRYLDGAEPRDFQRGDTNGDTRLDASDAICALLYLFAGDGACAAPDCADAIDFDDNGSLQMTDAVALLEYLFDGGAAPPPPLGKPGPDPTEDDLPCSLEGSKLGYEPLESEYLVEIFGAWLPTVRQEEAFRENGFVIYDNIKFDSVVRGYFEVYRRDLPVYISVDSILDALRLSFERLLIDLEERVLFKEIDAMLAAMATGIEDLQSLVPVDIAPALDDIALWLCVAKALLHNESPSCAREVDNEALEIASRATAAEGLLEARVLGAVRTIDFSQFRLRGHYSRSERLGQYFRAMMWIQRVGLEFTNQRTPGATQRAALLTRLLEDTGAIKHWRVVDETVAALLGVSDSLNPPGLSGFMDERGFSVADLWDETRRGVFVNTALEAEIGRQRINSALIAAVPTHPEGFTPFPPLFHVLGQRFTIDSHVFQNLTHDRVRERLMPSPLDAWFALGNRATLPLLANELRMWSYHADLAAIGWLVDSHDESFWENNLYNVWLSALRDLDVDTTSERYPPVMRTETWERRILHTQLASWAHLRHDSVLYAKASFPPNGCYYPDGWVDPYPEVYERIGRFAARASEVQTLQSLPTHATEQPYFARLAEICSELAALARAELDGLEFTEKQTEFVRSLLFQRNTCGGREEIDRLEPNFFDGWYSQLVYQFDGWGGEPFDPTIADVHSATWNGAPVGVLEVGVGHPRLMLISVKNECGIRAYTGPVLSYHEFIEPGDDDGFVRWTDEDWKKALEDGYEAPRPGWAREFVK